MTESRPTRDGDLGRETGGPLLGTVVEWLGPQVLAVLTAPAGLDVPVGPAFVHDPVEPLGTERHAIVLAVGSLPEQTSTCELIEAAARAQASAVVLKLRAEHSDRVVSVAERAGIALLAAPDDMSWRHLDALLTSASAADTSADAGGRMQSFGDLFALANAVAATVGGAVSIEDPQKRVLAYSNLPDQPIDQAREQGILGRQVPDLPGVAELYRQLWRHRGPVRSHLVDQGLRPRLAVAVRAGDEGLGSLWVIEGNQPFSLDAEQALADASKIAALTLLRARSAADLNRRTRADLLSGLLKGDGSVAHLAARLDLDLRGAVAIIAFTAVEDPASELVRLQIADLASVSCESFHRSSVCLTMGGITYAMAPLSVAAAPPGRLVRLADEVVSRANRSLHVTLQAGIGSVVAGLRQLPRSRHEADQVLRVLASEHTGPRVATIGDVRSKATLLELADGPAGSAALRLTGLTALLRHDAQRQTAYATTLNAYFETFGDIPAAADRVGVHQNTFRYRLRRIVELFHISLDDPDELLVLWLQLRLLGLGDAGDTENDP